MPSAPAAAAAASAAPEIRLRSHLEQTPLKFHVKAGNAKWACTLIHRSSLERQRAARTDSSTSTASTTSNSSASSAGSH